MKEIIWSFLIIAALCFWIAAPAIHFKPFHITIKQPLMGVAAFLIMLGCVCIYIQGNLNGRNEAKRIVKEVLEKMAVKN